MSKLNLFAVLFLACLPTRAVAQDRTDNAPQIEWTESTRLALAQCLVAEVGWRHRTEHTIIAHVLERRWRRAIRRNPRITFENTIRSYCAMHRHADVRRPWLVVLTWAPMVGDPGFEATVTWTNYIDAWEYVRTTVELFEKGALVDPLPLARHWGGRMDGVPLGGVLLARSIGSVELKNLFYAVDDALVRRIRAARRRAPATGVVSARLAQGSRS